MQIKRYNQLKAWNQEQKKVISLAEIIIPLALPKNYTWSIPDSLAEQAKPGCRVEVILGKNKKYAGIIKRLHSEHPAEFEVKDILSVLDPEPIISEKQFQLWEWIAKYYMCSEGEVMAAALPAHFKLSSETVLVYNEEAGEDFSMLDANEYLVAEALLIKKELRMSELGQILDETPIYPVVKRLIEKKICFVWEALKQTYTEKKETFVLLNPQFSNEEKLAELLNNWGRAAKQLELLLAYIHLAKTQGEVTKPELLKKSGASEAQMKALADKNILILEKRSVDRLKYLPRDINIDFSLTPSQEEAFQAVQTSLQEKPVSLLHGATSSGKTLIYIRLIEELIRTGKQALYLLPEIALTSQIIRRLQKYFGGYIGIYHSKFSQNERVEIWNKVRAGELKVILGARSSLFLPFVDLGLIIIDEEHDVSFKQQDPAPRYNARDAAVYYASLYDAKVVMGSATPSVETYYNGRTGKYGLIHLQERYGGTSLPEIEIVDISKRLFKNKERVIITPELEQEIKKTVANGKQVILFQNRRGYAPYQICEVCGWIPHCRYCDVSLTYHKQSHKLHCHYCGTLYPPLHSCLRCGSDRFLQRNFGTEKIEEQLDEIFSEARVARMDVDTVRGKNAHDNLIQLFEQQRIDILVGTQMVVKGLDFEHVQLVGVLDADSLLGFADFRVNERAFQLMEQVSGRSGRKGERGKMMIQVANTRHPVLQYVRHHDYLAFYASEIESRNRFFYPPYSRLILITCKHVMKDVAAGAAARLAEALAPAYGKYLVGPAEPIVNRVRNQYLMELLIKLPKDGNVVRECKQFILELTAMLHNEKKFRSVVITPDVDPL